MGAGDYMGAVGAVAGSAIGALAAQGNYAEIAKIREQAMKLYGDISLPTLEKVAKSQLGGVQMDQQYRGAEDAALQKLMGIANAGGMDPQAEEKLNAAKMASFDVQRGMQGSADQSLARRGMMNSGAAVTSAQGAAQAGINRENQGAIAAAGDASQRGLEALMAGGKMAQSMGQNDLAQKDKAASANDRINEFNSGLPAKQFGMEMDLAKAKAGVGELQAGDQYDTASRTQSTAKGVGQGAGAIAGMLYDENGNAVKKKDPNEDVFDSDPSGGETT